MDRMLPFGLPGPTAFYVSLYVATLAVHVVFMNYVLAGVGYLAVASFRGKRKGADGGPVELSDVLRDWMPFATSAAITAGVAPLLFVQILYRKEFYTANLLLFHRWMAILPLLIVGFYLLYLLKTPWIAGQSAVVRGVVALGALACFSFTGLSWTENHLLSTDRASWPGLYERGSMVYYHPQLLPRLGMWAVGAIPTMCALAAWQMYYLQRKGVGVDPRQPRNLARLAIAGVLLSVACGAAYWRQLDASAQGHIVGKAAGPYFAAACFGLVLQVGSWLAHARRSDFPRQALMVCTLGLALTIAGMTAVREAIRLSAIDVSPLYAQHADAARKGGLVVFVVFFLVNAGLIGWCLCLTRKRSESAAIE